jgi:CBS domain-containing protein
MAATARDLMETEVVTVGADDPIETVERVFFEEGIHGAPVVDDQMRLLGVVSSTDLLRAAAEGRERGWDAPPGSVSARRTSDVMTDGVVAVGPDASIDEVARTLCDNQVHRVLVLEDWVLRGIISSLDLVKILAKGA